MGDDPEPKPDWLPGGEPSPKTGATVASHHPDQPPGSRQDGPGAGPKLDGRTDATPAGTTAARRSAPEGGTGASDDPFGEHRGQPAPFRNGAAEGSGASAGGGGADTGEDLDPDDRGGGGRAGGLE